MTQKNHLDELNLRFMLVAKLFVTNKFSDTKKPFR